MTEGAETTTEVLEVLVIVAYFPPKDTWEIVPRSVPDIVTAVPPAIGPLVGEMFEIVGNVTVSRLVPMSVSNTFE